MLYADENGLDDANIRLECAGAAAGSAAKHRNCFRRGPRHPSFHDEWSTQQLYVGTQRRCKNYTKTSSSNASSSLCVVLSTTHRPVADLTVDPPSNMVNHYAVLGVQRDATGDEIKKA